MSAKKLLLLLLIAMGVQACGQVGPLYHPDETPPIYVPENPNPEDDQ